MGKRVYKTEDEQRYTFRMAGTLLDIRDSMLQLDDTHVSTLSALARRGCLNLAWSDDKLVKFELTNYGLAICNELLDQGAKASWQWNDDDPEFWGWPPIFSEKYNVS